ncbi:polysaccharide deacetylase family protein [Ferruginibacter sp. SUN002]|uniref:polysaccharide deacetylase family protein n=1 Tax=Ferruginibacter sp. SUN002 TaxID=2937789 RepID=UPI003D35A2CF
MFYTPKTPRWLKKIYGSCEWDVPVTNVKTIYLTFDDGPHPTITPFVLNELNKYDAKATFFCIGNNVETYPEIYKQVITEGHSVGNHTFDHLNGWRTDTVKYLQNIAAAEKLINSDLFRPPYGRISRSQIKALVDRVPSLRIIMWSVLSGDFDNTISTEKCLDNVLENAGDGSIIVFHDSEKAFKNLQYALPETLKYFSKKGYQFKNL